MLGSPLALMAMRDVANEVASEVVKAVAGGDDKQLTRRRVLVTTNADLAAGDAVFQDVQNSLQQLGKLIEALNARIDEILSHETDETPRSEPRKGIAPAVAVAGAVAELAPQLLGLFSAHRSLTTSSVVADDAVASMSVAGALRQCSSSLPVVLENFRTLPKLKEGILSDIQNLRISSAELSSRQAELTKRGKGAAEAAEASAAVALVNNYLDSVTKAPTGESRSALVTSLLYEQLHCLNPVTHCLLIKAYPGTAHQLLEDRPMMFKDQVSIVASTGIAYSLLEVASGEILVGGALAAAQSLNGKLGTELKVLGVKGMDFSHTAVPSD